MPPMFNQNITGGDPPNPPVRMSRRHTADNVLSNISPEQQLHLQSLMYQQHHPEMSQQPLTNPHQRPSPRHPQRFQGENCQFRSECFVHLEKVLKSNNIGQTINNNYSSKDLAQLSKSGDYQSPCATCCSPSILPSESQKSKNGNSTSNARGQNAAARRKKRLNKVRSTCF